MINSLANCILKIDHGIKSTNRPEDRETGKKFLATLAPILAAAELSKNELEVLNVFERQVGHSFLVEPEPFGSFYQDWKEFKEQCERLLVSGMTVNERLWALGLIESFEEFVKMKEWEECKTILHRVFLEEGNVDAIIDKYKKG